MLVSTARSNNVDILTLVTRCPQPLPVAHVQWQHSSIYIVCVAMSIYVLSIAGMSIEIRCIINNFPAASTSPEIHYTY